MSRINKRLKYNIDEVKEIIKKYKTLKEFRLKEPKAYGSVIRHKDRWLLKDLSHSENSYNRWIYAYEFKELNKVYVGLTWDVKKRHGQHMIKGTVHNFLKEHNIEELPHPLIVEGLLHMIKMVRENVFGWINICPISGNLLIYLMLAVLEEIRLGMML